MSVKLNGTPTLQLTYMDPILAADEVKVQSAKWDGGASVCVKDEQGKRWRIGFVQVLHKNVMTALYTKTKKSEMLTGGSKLPVLDGPDGTDWRPFYDKSPETKEVNMAPTAGAGTQQIVQTIMYDRPNSAYDWWHNDDATDPLQEFIMYLTFATYIAARDVTGGAGINHPMKMVFPHQWDVVLDRRFKFKVVRGGATDPPRADLTKTKWSVENPSRVPAVHSHPFILIPDNALLTGKIANDVFRDDIANINAIQVGEGVRALASKFGGLKPGH